MWPLTPRATSNNMRIQHISISKLDSYNINSSLSQFVGSCPANTRLHPRLSQCWSRVIDGGPPLTHPVQQSSHSFFTHSQRKQFTLETEFLYITDTILRVFWVDYDFLKPTRSEFAIQNVICYRPISSMPLISIILIMHLINLLSCFVSNKNTTPYERRT